ncbi:MAG: hypothetical protein M0Z82_17340 [Actinomycetota bacterium]|nr:hypothetical protein [Actinomycetota bacterium]
MLSTGGRKPFLHLTDAGRGVLTTWLSRYRKVPGEVAALLVHQQGGAAGQVVSAHSFARRFASDPNGLNSSPRPARLRGPHERPKRRGAVQ